MFASCNGLSSSKWVISNAACIGRLQCEILAEHAKDSESRRVRLSPCLISAKERKVASSNKSMNWRSDHNLQYEQVKVCVVKEDLCSRVYAFDLEPRQAHCEEDISAHPEDDICLPLILIVHRELLSVSSSCQEVIMLYVVR